MSLPKPAMTKVTSSNIESIGYLDLDLYVKFHNGTVYVHRNVEPDIFQAFRETDSPGKFYAGRVKGKYTSEKVDIDEPKEEKQEKAADTSDPTSTESLQNDLGTGQGPEGTKPADLKDVSETPAGTGTAYAGPTDAEKLEAEKEKKAEEQGQQSLDANGDGNDDLRTTDTPAEGTQAPAGSEETEEERDARYDRELAELEDLYGKGNVEPAEDDDGKWTILDDQGEESQTGTFDELKAAKA